MLVVLDFGSSHGADFDISEIAGLTKLVAQKNTLTEGSHILVPRAQY